MKTLKQTREFRRWRNGLKDRRALGLIASRLDRLAWGHAGDAKPVGKGVSELRFRFGPGYRIYFMPHGETIVILLCGGDKSTQQADIKAAHLLAQKWSD